NLPLARGATKENTNFHKCRKGKDAVARSFALRWGEKRDRLWAIGAAGLRATIIAPLTRRPVRHRFPTAWLQIGPQLARAALCAWHWHETLGRPCSPPAS
nr:hypothetical protein [Tanacetum cinerariifolium]